MPGTPDDALREDLAAGRDDAFAALYGRYGAPLLRVAWRMLGSRDEAEDAVQDVFVGLVQAGEALRRVRSLRAYLFASLRHAALRRRQARPRGPERSAAGEPASGADPADPRTERLERALRSLPTEQREIIALHLDGEMTFAEAAEVLGVSPNTAASRYRYALEKLREALKEA
jgi:RNA polymerase sigma-70 factor (ECF subfamily)